jgi:hypothetical protein
VSQQPQYLTGKGNDQCAIAQQAVMVAEDDGSPGRLVAYDLTKRMLDLSARHFH